jgi:multiple sugar transport system substrate-binding protein
MVRRYVVMISFFVILVTSGCRVSEEGVVTFAVGGAPAELDFWETIVEDFEHEHGIKVDLVRQPTDTDQRRQGLVIAMKSQKRDPDVFLMDVAWIAQMAASGWLAELDGYVESGRMDLGVFFDKVLNLSDRYQGRLIALPVYVDGGLLYYRDDLLQKHGVQAPPETWEQLVMYSQNVQQDVRVNNPQFYGYVWQGAQYEGLVCNYLEVAASNSGGILFDDGDLILNVPQNVVALQFMHDLIHTYRISPPSTFTEMKEEEVRFYFQKGDALFERNWPYAWALHQGDDSDVKGSVGIAPLPHFQGGESVSTLGGWHIGISKYSDVTSSAWKFVHYVVSYRTQKRLAMKLGWNPGRKDVYADDEVLEKLPHFARLRQVFDEALPRPNLPYYTQISEVLQRYLNAAIAGKLPAEAALVKAEQEAQRIVDRYSVGEGR